ncbi:MAG: hypothetical protein HW416_2984 [Chloroflexi bacterium]|nr:hypothetical protein [Chloroflexota bacterium]
MCFGSRPRADCVNAFNTVLDPAERIRQRVTMARVLSEELPVVMFYGTLQGTPHLAVLTGPMPIEADTIGYTAWNLHDWELR